ncbi:MAG: hypothetical protein IJ981_03055 [Clostridia bacterium]|nr:hypothetical protein [Clostridia bacterium]
MDRDYEDPRDRAMRYEGEREDRNYDRGYDKHDMYDRNDRNYDRAYDRGYDREYDRYDQGYERRHFDDYDSAMDMEYNDIRTLNGRKIQEWERKMYNADGTRGAKFDKDQVKRVMEQNGIKGKDFNEEEFCACVNMLYSDYCKILGGDINLYAKMAKAFLMDEDAGVKGGEKLAAYYHCIVEA